MVSYIHPILRFFFTEQRIDLECSVKYDYAREAVYEADPWLP